ncbi:peptidase M16 [Marinobacterium nitratireducens]|uniref:Protease 3 n=1 Tax=Marinobacterium nitratireducens TaxID=518897 RepID=A0A918DTI5_9GAMM|nr:insulinase family protein [Marinobacterium nitratireducens]GGO82751.1 peptidase M16 [Marinobacterium nitratireducens]
MMTKRLLAPLTLLLFWLLASLAQAAADIRISPNDDRIYDSFTLGNGLEVMVISDADTDKAAASLDVDVGSNADPAERQGLAHFLEHMLFLGTEKYPEAGAYQAFIRANGGSHNAYTSYDNTNYFFDVSADQLEPTLDRFAQFFIAPLFDEKYVDRERHAVHSEYQSGLRDDGRRIWSVYKRLINPEHSFSQFNVGSLDTLANDDDGALRRDLIDFYRRYYSANLMRLVVLGKEPVSELRAMVEKRFDAVPNFDAKPYRNKVPLYREGTLPAQLDIRTLDDTHNVTLSFPLPPARDYWAEKPLYYLSSLIGYEGHGSLLSALKSRGWANGLSASSGMDLPDSSSLIVSMDLTEAGMTHYQEVVALFFSYIRLLRQDGIDAGLYDEERRLAETRFRFAEPGDPSHYVRRLSRALQEYPVEHAVDANFHFSAFDGDLIRRFLEPVRPDNMLLSRQARNLDTDQLDPWYQAGYRLMPLTDAKLAQWRRNPDGEDFLAVRNPNPFIADDLALKPLQPPYSDRPRQILAERGAELWFQQDSDFRVPRADFFFSLQSSQANADATSSVLTALYTRMVNDALNETLYDAGLAGLSANLYPHLRGVSVRLSGFSERQPVLLDALLEAMARPTLDPARFELLKRQLAQELANERNDKPYNQTTGELYDLLLPQYSSTQRLAALEPLDLAQLRAFIPRLLAKTSLRALAHGNLLPEDAIAMTRQVNERLRADAQVAVPPEIPVVQLKAGEALVQTLPIDHADSAVTLYFQGADTRLKTRAAYGILGEMLASPFYNELRTEQQLGYIVFASPLPLRHVPGLAFVVQSPVADPVTLEQKIDAFLADMQSDVDSLVDGQLDAYRTSALSRLLEKESTLNQRSRRYWQELDNQELDFDSREQLAAALRALTVDDVRQAFAGLGERSLLVRSFGNGVKDEFAAKETGRRADDRIAALKAAHAFVPEA